MQHILRKTPYNLHPRPGVLNEKSSLSDINFSIMDFEEGPWDHRTHQMRERREMVILWSRDGRVGWGGVEVGIMGARRRRGRALI